MPTAEALDWKSWSYFLLTLALAAVFLGIILHYFTPSRKKDVEGIKYRMLEDEDEPPVVRPKGGRADREEEGSGEEKKSPEEK